MVISRPFLVPQNINTLYDFLGFRNAMLCTLHWNVLTKKVTLGEFFILKSRKLKSRKYYIFDSPNLTRISGAFSTVPAQKPLPTIFSCFVFVKTSSFTPIPETTQNLTMCPFWMDVHVRDQQFIQIKLLRRLIVVVFHCNGIHAVTFGRLGSA